jgi:hypothetical protein
MVFGDSRHDYEVEFPDGKGGNLGTKPTFTISEDFMAPTDESTLDKARLQPQRHDKSAEHHG